MINRKFEFSKSLQKSDGEGAGENARYLAVWGLRCAVLDSCAVELLDVSRQLILRLSSVIRGYFANIRPFLPQNKWLYIRSLAFLRSRWGRLAPRGALLVASHLTPPISENFSNFFF